MLLLRYCSIRILDGRQLIAVRVKCEVSQRRSDRYTVIYCHQGGIDIGEALVQAMDFSFFFHCDIVTFDYTGYGPTMDEPRAGKIDLTANLHIYWVEVKGLSQPFL